MSRSQWLNLIPVPLLRFALTFVGTGLSLAFLVRNLYPVLANAPNVSARALVPVIAVLHLGLGLALWWGFMAGGGGAISNEGGAGPLVPGLPVGGGLGDEEVTRVVRRWLGF